MYNESSTNSNFLTVAFQALKAALLSLAVCVLGAILFAIVLRVSDLPDKIILPVNETLKAVAIFVGCLFSVKESRGFIKGALAGALLIMLSYLAFSALGGNFSLTWLIFLELLFGVIVGGASGAFAVNIRSSY